MDRDIFQLDLVENQGVRFPDPVELKIVSCAGHLTYILPKINGFEKIVGNILFDLDRSIL